MKRFTLVLPLFALLAVLLFSACDRMIDTRPIPSDGDPGISLATPDRSNFLRTTNSAVDITLQLTDNEALKILRITESLFSNTGDTLLLDSYAMDESIAGTVLLHPFSYPITTSVQGIPITDYYKIKVTFYVLDTKGASAETSIIIDIVPEPGGDPLFPIRGYFGNELIHPNTFSGNEDFNFYNPLSSPTNVLDMDIKIVDAAPGPLSGKYLISPNNDARGTDSVFVITDSTRLNYEESTYTTLREAFYAGANINDSVAMPAVGQLLIIRLSKGQFDQFAVMKPTEYGGGSGGNPEYLRFDYRVTN